MLLICILILFFQPLILYSRLMTSCHVTCHVNTVTYFFIVQEIKKKEKEKKNQIKENR